MVKSSWVKELISFLKSKIVGPFRWPDLYCKSSHTSLAVLKQTILDYKSLETKLNNQARTVLLHLHHAV